MKSSAHFIPLHVLEINQILPFDNISNSQRVYPCKFLFDKKNNLLFLLA